MPRPPRISDGELLLTLGELGVSTTPQLALALDQHPGTLGKRITSLVRNGAICRYKVPPDGRRGHPLDLLMPARDPEPSPVVGRRSKPAHTAPPEPGPALVSHTLLLNELLARICRLPRSRPDLGTAIRSSERHGHPASPRSGSGLTQTVNCPDTGEAYTFEPDAAFLLGHRDEPQRLLFLVEADRGTESKVHQDRGANDFRHKVRAYQACFASGAYRHYADACPTALCLGPNDAKGPVAPGGAPDVVGFRLLVLACDRKRATGLGRLLRAMPPSDFVWVTDIDRLRSEDVVEAIWWPGGHADRAPRSILGKHAAETEP